MQHDGEILPIKKGRSGRGARLKGVSFERWVANRLKPIDPTAQRNLEETRLGTYDIDLTIPFAIQCKCMKAPPNPMDVWYQAHDGMRGQDRIPVGVVKVTHKQPIFTIMQESHFRDLFDNEIDKRKVYWHVHGNVTKRESRSYFNFYVETIDKAPADTIPVLVMRFYRDSNSFKRLVFIDFEHFLKQLEFKYGKKHE
jgi:hypothetical protein